MDYHRVSPGQAPQLAVSPSPSANARPSVAYSMVSDLSATQTEEQVRGETEESSNQHLQDVRSSKIGPTVVEKTASRSTTLSMPPSLNYRNMYLVPPIIAISLTLIGTGVALGHHFFLNSLNNELALHQESTNRYSLVLAFLVKASLTAAMVIAYSQFLWLNLQRNRSGLSVAALDKLFSAPESPLIIFSPKSWRDGLLPLLLAVPVWLMPVTSIVSPTALTVGKLVNTTTILNCQVPTVDMQGEVQRELVGDYKPVAAGDSLSQYEYEGYYLGPGGGAMRMVNPVASNGKLTSWDSPCGTNCTYEVKFTAPAWQCTPSEHLNPAEAPWATNYTCESPWISGNMCGNGNNITYAEINNETFGAGFEYASVYQAGVNTTTHTLWVGISGNFYANVSNPNTTTVADALDLNIFSCNIMNTTYHISVNYTNSQQAVKILDKQSTVYPRLPQPVYATTTETGDYLAILSLYDYMAGMFAGFIDRDPRMVLGTVGTNISVMPTFTTYNSSSNQAEYLPVFNLAPLIEELSHNVSISLMSNPSLKVTNTTMTTCISTETLTVWKYDRAPLVIAYAVAVGITLAFLLVGAVSVLRNGAVFDRSFSTMLRATRGADLDRLVEGHEGATLPVDDGISEAKLKFATGLKRRLGGGQGEGFYLAA